MRVEQLVNLAFLCFLAAYVVRGLRFDRPDMKEVIMWAVAGFVFAIFSVATSVLFAFDEPIRPIEGILALEKICPMPDGGVLFGYSLFLVSLCRLLRLIFRP